MKTLIVLFAVSLGCGTFAQNLYLQGTLEIPKGAVVALPQRAQTEGIPIASFSPALGTLVFTGAKNEEELLAQNSFLYVDGDFFLLGLRENQWTTVLRGSAEKGELVIFGPGIPEKLPSFTLLETLGLIPKGTVELSLKEIPTKIPAPPEGIKLDPTLWALVEHPDWFQFAQEKGIERVGIRVRVVAELNQKLSPSWEPFIKSSTENLVELLIPIPLLPQLGQDPAVKLVRPPHIPVPLGG